METVSTHRSRRSHFARGLAVLAAVLVVSTLSIQGSRAAFSATTSNGVNNFAAGTVLLTDDDANSVMFNLSGMAPGSTSTKCINVAYTGTVTSNVKLYAAVGGTGLDTYLTTVIDVGNGATGGATGSCANFVTPTNLHNGTLAGFVATPRTNYANGDGTGFAGATNGTTRSYRIQVTLQDNNLAQGLNASATFTWEAQNV